MTRSSLCLLMFSLFAPARAGEKRVDQQGDPLPPGAVARMGTVRWRVGGYVYGLAFSPDDKTLASGSIDDVVRLWGSDTGKEIRRLGGHDPWVTSVAWSPDGKTLASAGADEVIRLREAATGKLVRTFVGHQGVVSCLAFAPDGKTLASGSGVISGGDATMRLWEVGSGKELFQGRHKGQVRSVAFTPDSKGVASAGEDGLVRLWEVATGKPLRQFGKGGRANGLTRVAVSADGRLLAAGGDRFEPLVLVWDV